MMNKFMASVLAMCCISFPALGAQTDDNRTISILAVEPGDRGYFRLVEGFTLSCQYNVVYFDVASSSGKGYLSLLMAAKMAEKKIKITYEQNASNVCNITHVTIL